VQRFLADAVVAAPLPLPWAMGRSSKGRHFFVNRRTGETSWSHPLESLLRELAGICRRCLALSLDLRLALLDSLHKRWDADARSEYVKWHSVEDSSSGRTYYCHHETGEAMWEHPAEALLPAHYLRIKCLERLRDERYIARLLSARPPPGCPSSRRLTQSRRVQPKAFYIGDANSRGLDGREGDEQCEYWPQHLTLDIDGCSSDFGGALATPSEKDDGSRCSSRSTETLYIGDEELSEIDSEPWACSLDIEDVGSDADVCEEDSIEADMLEEPLSRC